MKIDVIPNGLEKFMALFLNKSLVFIDSMHFIKSSLDKLVKNLSDSDFKYLIEEFGFKNLELLKQKVEEKLSDRKCFYSSAKDGTANDNGKKLDGHISDENYLTCKEIWGIFDMKNMGDYHNHLKKDVVLLAAVFEKFIGTCLKFYGLDPLSCDVKNDWYEVRKNIL